MDAHADDWQPVLEKLSAFKRGWVNPVWTWDDRFRMIASSFPKEQEMQARTCASQVLLYCWNKETLPTAPNGLREICQATGGLRSGQLLMAGKAGHIVLVGLWWPWAGGETITLRIGLGAHAAMEPPFPQVRDLFGVRSQISPEDR